MRKIVANIRLTVVLLAILVAMTSCKMSYSFSGVNISPEVLTYSVDYFQNRAALVQAQLSQVFTDAMMDKIQGNTNLDLSNQGGDVQFSGEITNYVTRPTAITSAETAARNRLTITVRVKYANVMELITLIVENLVEDIFNKAFISW